MTPGPYEIPSDVQADMRTLVTSLTQYADKPPIPIPAAERKTLLTICERLTTLEQHNFSGGNVLVLMKPDMTFGIVRMGAEYLARQVPTSVPEPVFKAAMRVLHWLDSLGHKYPARPV